MQYRKWTDNNADKPTHSWGSWVFFLPFLMEEFWLFVCQIKQALWKCHLENREANFFWHFLNFQDQTNRQVWSRRHWYVSRWQETIRRKEIGENFLFHVIVGNKCIFVSLEVSIEIAADALYSEKQRLMVTVCYKWQTGLNEVIQRTFHNQPALQVWLIIFKTHEGTVSLQHYNITAELCVLSVNVLQLYY